MIDISDKQEADCRFAAATKTDGVNAFMDFDRPLQPDMAQSLVQELKVWNPHWKLPNVCISLMVTDLFQAAFPHMTPDQDRLQRYHQVLRSRGVGKSIAPHVGEELLFTGLGFFLETCDSLFLDVSQNPGLSKLADTEYACSVYVRDALRMTKVHLRHKGVTDFRSPSKDGVGSASGETTEDIYEDVCRFLQSTCKYVERVQVASAASLELLMKEYGGILKRVSWKDFMVKVGATVDVESFKLCFMEASAFNVALLQRNHNTQLAPLEDLVKYMKAYIEIRFPDAGEDTENQSTNK